jgi:hypothetical protein
MDTMTRPRLPLMETAAGEYGGFENLWVDITLDPPTSRRRLSALRLHAGQVDEDTAELYGYSACARLAGAIHELSGWTILVTKTVQAYRINPPNIGVDSVLIHHVGIRDPFGGHWLDVLGTRDDREILSTYSAGWVTESDVAEMNEGHAYDGQWDSGLEGTPFREFTLYLAHTLISRTVEAAGAKFSML